LGFNHQPVELEALRQSSSWLSQAEAAEAQVKALVMVRLAVEPVVCVAQLRQLAAEDLSRVSYQ
jgi:heterodisulfide reductase subunit A-like polyferredoxin